MVIPGPIRKLLHTAVLTTKNEPLFRQFLTFNVESFGLKYDNDTAANKPYEERLFDSIEWLNRNGKLLTFIDKFLGSLNEGQRLLPEVVSFSTALTNVFIRDDDNAWRLQRALFKEPMIRNNLPFVDRESVTDQFYDMIGDDGPPIVVINGQSRSGLSYIRWILNEVVDQSAYFELIQIDIKRHVKPYAGEGLVTPDHLAQCISDTLEMAYNATNVKIVPFKARLKSFLHERQHRCLFYIHQFDVVMADACHDFMHGFLEAIIENNANGYIVLSGYPRASELPHEWTMMRAPIDIGHGTLTRAHVMDFYRRYYECLSKKKTLNFTLDEFLKKVDETLPEGPFDPANPANAMLVGRMLADWFRNNAV